MIPTDYFKITYSDGRVEYEVRTVAPSEKVREIHAIDPGATIGMVRNLPPEIRLAVGVEVGVGDTVTFRAYGVDKIGRVEKVGRKNAQIRITTRGGTIEKVITRPIHELTVTR